MLRNHNCPTATDRLSTPAGTLMRSKRRTIAASGHNCRHSKRKPARPRINTAVTAIAPSTLLTAVPRAMPTKPNRGIGPKPWKKPQASGTLNTATPARTHSPVMVSPAPTRQAMPAASITWKTSRANNGCR